MAQQVLSSIDKGDLATMLVNLGGKQAMDVVLACCRSVESVLQILDRTLSVLWPPPSG